MENNVQAKDLWRVIRSAKSNIKDGTEEKLTKFIDRC